LRLSLTVQQHLRQHLLLHPLFKHLLLLRPQLLLLRQLLHQLHLVQEQ
jgi:hypothetical protein